MAMHISKLLLDAQSSKTRVRTDAAGTLQELQEQNPGEFLLSLSLELASNDEPSESRQLAGTLLKNSLDDKDPDIKYMLVEGWFAIDVGLKSQIKDLLLRTLDSPVQEARHISAQVIAKVASIEIPKKQWPKLIASLVTNMTNLSNPAHLKQSTLETLGYVCEEISPHDLVQDEVNSVLAVVVQGMNQSENTAEVGLAATKALLNALDFSQANFENETERSRIMDMVCETACSNEAEIRQAAFECLVFIASTYYGVLEQYMEKLRQLTWKAIKGEEECVAIALLAIEFWSSICDQEYESPLAGDSHLPKPNSCFIKNSLACLVPMLLETLEKQEEGHDNDVWNISMAGGTCLGLIAKIVGDAILPFVLPFVETNREKPDWQSREAATYALGSILEGPTVEKLAQLFDPYLEFLLRATNNENNHAKDITAWTLSRVFEFLHSPESGFSVISHENLPRIVGVLLKLTKDMPNVAEKVCGAIYNLARGYEHCRASPSLLSPHLPEIINHLLAAAERTESKLSNAAYETLNEVFRCLNLEEASSIIPPLLPDIINKLNEALDFHLYNSVEDRVKQAELQASLCGVLQVVIQMLSSREETKLILKPWADKIMGLLVATIQWPNARAFEEAMLAISALAYATGTVSKKYMPKLVEILEERLNNVKEYKACSITVGVIGDICRVLHEKILPDCAEIMTLLIQSLEWDALDISVKPQIFTTFGDIALAIGADFESFLAPALQIMQKEVLMCANVKDKKLMVHVYQLEKALFETYSGILHAIKNGKADLIIPHAQHLFEFVEFVSKDPLRYKSVAKAAVAAMGDLADVGGDRTKQLFFSSTFYGEYLNNCLLSEDPELKAIAWDTRESITRLNHSAKRRKLE